MKESKIIPLEEIAFAKYIGELNENFTLDENNRLPRNVRNSNLFKGFRDGYFDFSHKYQNMSEWKKNIIAFFAGGDYLTAYNFFYSCGQECRKNGSLPNHQFVEVAHV